MGQILQLLFRQNSKTNSKQFHQVWQMQLYLNVVIFITSPCSSLWNINKMPSDLTRFEMNIRVCQVIAWWFIYSVYQRENTSRNQITCKSSFYFQKCILKFRCVVLNINYLIHTATESDNTLYLKVLKHQHHCMMWTPSLPLQSYCSLTSISKNCGFQWTCFCWQSNFSLKR